MNTEILIGQAGCAIAVFTRNHDGACCLTVKNGFVTGIPCTDVSYNHPKALRVERYELRRGLTTARWHAIGRELYILYSEEIICQPHPKP